MTTFRFPIACLALSASLGWGPAPAHAQNVAIVNGQAVPKSLLAPARARELGLTSPGPRSESELERVMMDEILVQAARQRGLVPTASAMAAWRAARGLGMPADADTLADQRRAWMIDALDAHFVQHHPVTDAELRAAYDKLAALAAETVQYRARHILVDSPRLARSIIQQLQRGTRFETLARRHSTDKASRAKGGDLGYSAADEYVPEFAQALTSLQKGDVTPMPVKTEFGHHVIRLEGTRQAPLLPFEIVQEQVRLRLEQDRLGAFHRRLRDQARTDFRFTAAP
jgi:peptidyl-prolyl cis-trans isomerase C